LEVVTVSSNVRSAAIFDPLNPRLKGINGKIKRALYHIENLDQSFHTWMNAHPWAIETETHPNGLVKRFNFRLLQALPDDYGLVLGDALHNLRSALDHLACAVAVHNGKSFKGVAFPISASRDAFPGQRDDKLIKCPKSFGDFVEDLQPYKGGNDLLYALHQLDILDKHRVLVPAAVGHKATIRAEQGLYGAIDFSKTSKPIPVKPPNGKPFIEDGDTIIDLTNPAFFFPETTKVEAEVALTIVFGPETPVSGRDLRALLGQFTDAVQGIVRMAEPAFLR
jgi:hypothetical protein